MAAQKMNEVMDEQVASDLQLHDRMDAVIEEKKKTIQELEKALGIMKREFENRRM